MIWLGRETLTSRSFSPTKARLRSLLKHFRELGHEVSVKKGETDQNLSWDVIVVQHMVPSHEGISNFESQLQSVADRWQGQNDGWGCFSGPS